MYLDGTEIHDGTTPPIYCPMCRSKLATRWRPVVMRQRRDYVARAMPVHVCKRCKHAVRLHRLPSGQLYETRAGARQSVRAELKRMNAARPRSVP